MPVSISPVRLATYVRQQFPAHERGALLIQADAGEDLVLAAFGNDRYRLDKRVNREVELLRRWLTAAGARELGFGVSPDGHSWALLVKITGRGYRTTVGQAFYAEMVLAEVEEEVDRAWLAACGVNRSPAPDRRAAVR